MFVDLDWPLNASSLLSASAQLLVSASFLHLPERFLRRWHCCCESVDPYKPPAYFTSLRRNSFMIQALFVCTFDLFSLYVLVFVFTTFICIPYHSLSVCNLSTVSCNFSLLCSIISMSSANLRLFTRLPWTVLLHCFLYSWFYRENSNNDIISFQIPY